MGDAMNAVEWIYRRELEVRFVEYLASEHPDDLQRAIVLRQILPALRGDSIDSDSMIGREFGVAHTTVGDARDAVVAHVLGADYVPDPNRQSRPSPRRGA